MNTVYLALGTNVGNRTANLDLVHRLISRNIGIVTKESGVYQTEAWGVENQPDYYNQVFCVKTALDPQDLLHKCQVIEKKLGRVRTTKWAARIMDIDILFYNDLALDTPELRIPHPLLQERNFVLEPLCEIAGELEHPILQKKIKELLQNCADTLPVIALKLAN